MRRRCESVKTCYIKKNNLELFPSSPQGDNREVAKFAYEKRET